MKIIAILSVLLIWSFAENIRIYKNNEIPSTEELRNIFSSQKESKKNSKLGKSKAFSEGFEDNEENSMYSQDSNIAKKEDKLEASKDGMHGNNLVVSVPIKFANNSYEIQSDKVNLQILSNLYVALQNVNVKLIIEGHTNAVGSSRHNTILSKKRAEAVKQYLVENGINSAMLVSVGKGFERPLEGYDPKDPNNRRVQFKVMN